MVVIADALWCPHCGAALVDANTRTATRESSPPHPPLGDARYAPGFVFATRYRIVNLLGRGAMGEVYRADDMRLGQAVALKLLSTRGSRPRKRFVDEVRLAREVAHPNVCRVYDLGEADGWHYLSMEYVDGETLKSLVQRIGRLPTRKTVEIVGQLLAGVAAAHDRGVLHRDLKPANIMVDGRGIVRILDFGLAVSTTMESGHDIAGTPAYMAPEQLAGGRATEQTDLFAVGLIMYELLTGRRFFNAATAADRLRLGRTAAIPTSTAEIDPELARIVTACLSDDPGARPRSALAAAALLPCGDPLTAAGSEGRIPPAPVVAAAAPQETVSPAIAWAALAAVVAGVTLVVWQGDVLTFPSSALPKPPQVLAERARALLDSVGHGSPGADSEGWFAAVPTESGPVVTRFFYRQSPRPLVPANLYKIVTENDPPPDVPGMATVVVDPMGRLVGLSRTLPSRAELGATRLPIEPGALMLEAGLDERDFERVEPEGLPAIPHDRRLGWRSRAGTAAPTAVTAATLADHVVYFAVGDAAPPVLRFRGPFARGTAELLFWLMIVAIFAGTAGLAKRNLRAGDVDRIGARRLFSFVLVGGVIHLLMRAHHVTVVQEEILTALGSTGWALVWAAFSWLAYVSFEPFVRRHRPNTLITWTALLHGRFHNSRVGRDVLFGALGGVALSGLTIVQTRLVDPANSGPFVMSALEVVRSSRQAAAIVSWSLLDGVQFALGTVFLVTLVSMAVRSFGMAAAVMIVLSAPLVVGGTSSVVGFLGAVAIGAVSAVLLLRYGLLALTVALICGRLLRHTPLTADPASWYFGTSALTVLLVIAVAVIGFIRSLGGSPTAAARSAAVS